MEKAVIRLLAGIIGILTSSCGHNTDGTTGATGKCATKDLQQEQKLNNDRIITYTTRKS